MSKLGKRLIAAAKEARAMSTSLSLSERLQVRLGFYVSDLIEALIEEKIKPLQLLIEKDLAMTAPAEDGRQVLIDQLGDVELVDTLLMKLWLAGFKLAPVEDDD